MTCAGCVGRMVLGDDRRGGAISGRRADGSRYRQRMRGGARGWIVTVASLALAACAGGDSTGPAADTAAATATSTATTVAASTTPTTDPSPTTAPSSTTARSTVATSPTTTGAPQPFVTPTRTRVVVTGEEEIV